MSTQAELKRVTEFIEAEARAQPGRVVLAILAELVDIACGDNPALRDVKRLQIYRHIAARLAP